MEKYIQGEPITAEELRRAVRAATLELKGFPVLLGASFKNKGVQPLLDAVVHYLPAPNDVHIPDGIKTNGGDPVPVKSDPGAARVCETDSLPSWRTSPGRDRNRHAQERRARPRIRDRARGRGDRRFRGREPDC
jgi:hypothetical protein